MFKNFNVFKSAKVSNVVDLAVMIAFRPSLLLAVNFLVLLGSRQPDELFNIVLFLVNAMSCLNQGLVINVDYLFIDVSHELILKPSSEQIHIFCKVTTDWFEIKFIAEFELCDANVIINIGTVHIFRIIKGGSVPWCHHELYFKINLRFKSDKILRYIVPSKELCIWCGIDLKIHVT